MKLSMKYLIAAAVYGVIGMGLGIVMGAQQEFSMAPVHAHINLLGWVALTLYGLVYHVVPSMTNGKLGTIQFYLANIGLLLMIPALTMVLKGNTSVVPVLAVGEICTIAALILFLVNLWKNRAQA